jgi:hypothetical protein
VRDVVAVDVKEAVGDGSCCKLAREAEGRKDNAVGLTVEVGTGEVVEEPGTGGIKGITAPSCDELDSAVVVSLERGVEMVGVEEMVRSGEP